MKKIDKIENNSEGIHIDLFTGIRPTANLTLANFIGAVAPILELQGASIKPLVFVADLHAITDNEPEVVAKYKYEIVSDYIALGLDPEKKQYLYAI